MAGRFLWSKYVLAFRGTGGLSSRTQETYLHCGDPSLIEAFPRTSRQAESEPGMDMEITEVVGAGHITEQVPLWPSLDRGKRVLKSKIPEASVDDELERLNREKPMILSASHPKPIRYGIIRLSL